MKNTTFFILCFLISSISFAQNWNTLSLPSTGRYDDVFFIDENIGWAINSTNYEVSKSTDGGETWNLQFSTVDEHLRNIVFLDHNRGFLGTLTSSFYKTSNGGQTWELINIPGVEAICGLDVVGDSIVYGCGAYFEPAYIIKSSDGGDNWTFIDMSAYATGLVEVLFIDEYTGFACGKNEDGGIILKTTDGGQVWTEIFNTGLPGEYVWKMQQLFSNQDVFFASVQSIWPNYGKMIKSIDGGNTWVAKDIYSNDPSASLDPSIQGIGFVSENHGWASGHYSTLLETFDGGDTWELAANGSVINVNRFQVINENLVFASGTQLYKYTNNLGTESHLGELHKGLEINISPNPIDNQLNISIIFEKKNHMVITLFDGQGKKIRQLARETILTEGEQVYSFDFPYPSGIYYVHFHSDVEAKSIKIVKD